MKFVKLTLLLTATTLLASCTSLGGPEKIIEVDHKVKEMENKIELRNLEQKQNLGEMTP